MQSWMLSSRKAAREEAEIITRESENLKSRFKSFRKRYTQMLQQELEKFESSSGFEMSLDNFDDLPELEVKVANQLQACPVGCSRIAVRYR